MLKKILSIILIIAICVIQVPENKSFAESKVEKGEYNYVMFADSVSVNALSSVANGDVYAYNTGNGLHVNGNVIRNKKEIMLDKQKSIVRDFILTDGLDGEKPETSNESIIKTTDFNNSIGAIKNISINTNVINANNVVLYSKNGDITINCDNFNFSGLIYAPKGNIYIKGTNVNIQGALISKKIVVDAKTFNINKNNYFVNYLGKGSDIYKEKKDIFTFNYDVFGNVESIFLDNQLLTKYVYSESFQPCLNKEIYGNGSQYDYDFNPGKDEDISKYIVKSIVNRKIEDGNNYHNVENNYANKCDKTKYTYDNSSNLSSVNSGEQDLKYLYDNKNQLVRIDDIKANISYKYTYDSRGNMLTSEKIKLGQANSKPAVNYYNYDKEWVDKLDSYNGEKIEYDTIGNPVQYRGWNFTWEKGRQLKHANRDKCNISYTYDNFGLRTSKNINGQITNYKYSDKKIVEQDNGNQKLIFLYDDKDEITGVSLDQKKYYYVKNLQGDIVKLVDENGEAVVSYLYDAWGNTMSIKGKLAETIGKQNPIRYRGYYLDKETNLYYLQSRYYDPVTCRFINADDFSYSDSEINLFKYCENNPMKFIDPNGYLSYDSDGMPIINSGSDSNQYYSNISYYKQLLSGVGFYNITTSKATEFSRCVHKYHIISKNKNKRLAHFLSQCAFESTWGIYLVERGSRSYFSHKKYGYKYRGGGYIMVTHAEEYKEASKALHDSKIYSGGANYVSTHCPWIISGWWWRYFNMNNRIDRGASVSQVTDIVSGDTTTVSTRKAYYNRIYKKL